MDVQVQKVVVNGTYTVCKPIINGINQGSVLGPVPCDSLSLSETSKKRQTLLLLSLQMTSDCCDTQSGQGSCPEGPSQAGGKNQQALHEINQGQISSAAAGQEALLQG